MGNRNTAGQSSTENKYKAENGSTQAVKDDSTLPQPKPPRKTKRQLMKNIDIKDIDTEASKVPRGQTTSVATLTSCLTSRLTSNVAKVRAIFYWITNNISYDTTPNFHDRGLQTDAATVLCKRSTVCIGYANLFADMCRQVNIPVKIISGYSKGFGYNPENAFTTSMKTDHAWNAVYLAGSWQFIECTWGAGYRNDHGQYIKKFSDFHFLTPPNQFILSHFPYIDDDMALSRKWQLLSKVMDIETFSRRAKGTSRLYEMRIQLTSHSNSVIDVMKSVEISLKYPQSEHLVLTARLYNKFGRNLDSYAMARRTGSNVVSVRVNPPEVGDYMLHLFGTNNTEIAELDALVVYVLKCRQVEASVSPYPQHTSLWGAYNDFCESGLHRSSSQTIEHRVRHGQITMKLKTTKVVDSIVKLDHAKSKIDESKCYAVLHREKNCLEVNARLPFVGKYKLSIFTKNNNADTFSPRMCYLIHCEKAMSPCIPFPKEFQQTTEYGCRLLEPNQSEIPADSEVTFRMISPILVQARVDRNMMTQRGKTWSVTFKTPMSGTVKIYGGNEKGDQYYALYQFQVVRKT